MATDTTHLPQGELNTDAGNDMAGSELEFGAVQLAQVTTDGGQPVQLPQGQQTVLVPVQAGQTLTLPTDSPNGLIAKIGPEGNLAIVVDGRTIILQGYVQANEQSPVRLVTSDGDQIDVADVIAATDPSLDIQTAAGPASGNQGETPGSGIYTPFVAGPGLDGLEAVGVLDPTLLRYKLIDDNRRFFEREEDTDPTNIEITFDALGGVINEDDLLAVTEVPNDIRAALVIKDNGNDELGNDPFDNDGDNDKAGNTDNDGNPDFDREPLFSVATVKVDFGPDVPGTLSIDDSELPTGLTSEGEPIIYEVLPAGGGQGNGIVAFVDNNGDNKFDEGDGDRKIFDIKVQEDSSNSEFHVLFTLYDNIDNTAPDANGDGAADLLGADEQTLKLPVKVTAEDSDPQGSSLSAVMNLGVTDDRPFFGEQVVIGNELISVTPGDSSITHDESWFPQSDDGADDQSLFDPVAQDYGLKAGEKVLDAGFGLPYGDSVGSLIGIAQTQVLASFGADGRSQEVYEHKSTDTSARDSIFGALSDRADGTIDGLVNGVEGSENERPFELFMIEPGKGNVPLEDKLGTVANEGNLTIEDQATNATVTWNGAEPPLQVFLRQVDAQTIVGYVIPPEGEGNPQEARAFNLDGENGEEAVFVLTIDDNGVMTFVQFHQINHDVDGPTSDDHDDSFQIKGEDGTSLVHVRISDYDGDHATQPVDIAIQDDGPKFCGVDWGCDNDSKNGKGIIDEDKLNPNGNNDWAPGDDKGGKHADGKIEFNFGVDKPGHVEAHALTVKDSDNQTLLAVTFSYVEDEFGERTYTVDGDSDLKTADGHEIAIEASYDAGTGLLTLIGRDTEDGSEAFVYTLQTTGYDKGEFTFCLNEPLYHPYTDSDSENDGPGKSFEDDLKFDLTVRGYDADGDWADGSICINVDDDSPKAECDYECVVEGKDGETLHFATGNVVTGDGNTVFGNDGNNLDGNADNPGADQPYSISKLKHDGTQYFLNTPEGGDPFVTKGAPAGEPGSQPLGAGEGFNPVTGILHIPTEQGGTLDIVLISDTLADVGDYKYTVPADADHDIDHHFGPEAADSASFGDLTAWQQSFSDHGITVSALGGSLVIKAPVNAVPETGAPSSYGGIGVNGGESDESEVDTDGNGSASEGLRLDISNSEFPGGVKNISLTLGALFDGTQYDSGNQEILQWEAWNGGFLVASGQILGDPDGLVTLDIDTLLPFDHIVLKPIDNGQDGESFANNSDFLLINAEICCPLDKFTEEFEYTLQDADGDESCATLKVDVKDTEPTHEHGQPFLTAFVVDEDGLPKGVGNTDSPFDDSEDHSLPNAAVDDAKHIGTIPFTPGADPTSIELTVFGGPDTGMNTLDNQNIFAAWDSATQTLVGYIEGTNPLDPANQIFKMTVTNPLTGAYTFELLQAVKHNNTDDFGIFGQIDNTENLLNLPTSFIVVAEIEDKDCDVLFSKVVVTIDDDMPVITPCHDENHNPINLLVNGSFEQLGTEDGGALDRGTWGVFSEIPGWTSGNADDPSKAGLEIQADGAVPQIDAKDGEHYAELDSDALNPNTGKPASTNASIYQDVDTQDGNNYVLSFSYSPRVGDPATDGIEVWFDGQLISTINSGDVGKWTQYNFVVEAGEGDGTVDSSRLEFKAVGTADSLGGFIDNVSLTACALVDEDLLPNGIEGGPGDDGVIGTSFDGSLGVNFGADEGKSIVFSESGQPNLKSGGVNVKYEWVDAGGGLGTLIAYLQGTDPNNPANQVFKVQVTSLEDGGQYTFTLLKPLDHPDNDGVGGNDSKDNGKGSFEDNLIFELKFKATDRDDDTVDGHLQINVDDDSPTIGHGEGQFSLATDETKGGGADVLPNPGTRAENDETLVALPAAFNVYGINAAIGEAQSGAAGLFTYASGADIPASAVFSLVVLNAATGMTDTATNSAVNLVLLGNGVVEGRSAVGNHLVFVFHVDPATGVVSMAQYRAINHGATEGAPGDHDEAAFFNSGVLGVNLKVTDFDKDAVNLTVDISGGISVDDDGPHATCDSDSVTEGAGNYATGNVVTGIDAALLDKDANLTDGNADNPGQDGPYTISKLAHDGDVYELSADGLSVTQNGGALVDGTFAGGKLTITTAEGATFEIIMVSPTQSEVGEYKYTPGPNPIHAEDVHVGPHTLADSLGGAFDTVTEWQTAFTNGGITLIPAGGALALKTVDVAGPDDYRGIGVDTGIDNGEVDTKSESLTLQFDAVKFPGGVNNAEVKLGAFFNGVQFDAGNQEIVKWAAYDGATLVASGQIVGSLDGVVTLDIDTPVNFNKIVLTPLDNGAGDNSGNNSDFLLLNVEVCKQEPVKEKFDYTLRDGDGDESTACLEVCVEDTVPSIPTETPPLSILVDEDGLANGIGNTTSPFDADEGDAGDDDAKISGNIPFTPGADPVTIELSVAGGDTGLDTLDGDDVHAAWDAATSTLIGYIEGTDPSDPANQVFKMTVTDHTTGAFTFELLQPIKHPNTDAGGANNNTENAQDPWFNVQVQIEDKDCDVAFTTVKVTIDDDMPVISAVDRPNFILAVDESLDNNSNTSGGDDVPGGGTTQEDDEDHFNLPDVLEGSTRIGEAQANAANLFSVDYGADGPGGDAEYSFAIKNGGVTGLIDTQSGTPITLSFTGDLVVGRNGSGTAVFAFHINEDTGQVSMAQYRAVNHGATEPAPGEHDEVIGFLYDALAVKLEISDDDQDVVSLERSISNLVTFDDDGVDAANDIDNIQTNNGGVTFFASGNVVTGASVTIPGVDEGSTDLPNVVSKVTNFAAASITPDSNGENIAGVYGTLRMESDGDYIYDFDESNIGKVPSGFQEVFTYTFTDKDGDSDTATLTINFPTVSIPEAKIGVGPDLNGSYKEDVANAIHFSVNPDGDDTVVHVKITGLTNWTFGGSVSIPGAPNAANVSFNAATGTLEFDVTGALPGATINGSFGATPPADTDVDQTLTIVGTVQDGPVQASDTGNATVVVDAVLDQYLDVTAGSIAPIVEPVGATPVNLNLSSGFAGGAGNPFLNSFAGGAGADGDSSEVVNLTAKITITGDAAQLQLTAPIVGVTLIETATPGVWELTADTLANLQTALTQVQAVVPAGFSGVINGSVEVTTAEANTPLVTPGTVVPGSGTENDTGDNTYTDKTLFSIQVEDGVKSPTVGVNFTAPSLVIKEDSSAFFIVTANVPDATDKISKLNFTGLEALILDGWGVVVTPEAPTTGSYLAGEFTVTSVGQTAQVRVTLTPPADSDRDVINDILADITVTATAADISTPALTATTAPLTVDVDVDAVLDQYVVVQTTASPTASESGVQQNVNLNLAATIDPGFFALSGAGGPDGDGSEVGPVSAQITLTSAAVDLTLGVGFPAGTTLDETAPNSGIWILTATNAANFQSAVTFVEAIIPAGFNGAIGVTVQVITAEANTPPATPGSVVPGSGQEYDNTDNTVAVLAGFTLTVDNSARNSISGEICFAEDTVFNQYDQSLAQTSAPGQILYGSVVTLGVDESLTALTITGIPAGASLTINGAAVTNGVALTAQQLADWKGGVPILVFPFDDSDVDFTLTFNGSTTDGSSGAVSPISGTVTVLVDAAADDPTSVTIDVVSSSGDEQFVQNETGTATITATFGDLTDGTETHTLTITAPAGFTFPSVANLDGILIGNVSGLGTGTVTVTVPAGDAGVSNFVLNVQAPANFAGTPTFQVEAKAVDAPTDLGCGPLDADDVTNNEATQTASDDVTFQANKLPIAYDDKKCGDEAAPKNVNLLLIFDNSGSMDADSGLPGGGVSKLEAAQQAAINMLNAFAATGGDVRVMLVTFNSDADREGTWLNLADAIDAINGIPQSGSTTNYEAAILDAISGFNDTDGRGDFATHDNLVYFLSDGEPTTGGNSGDNSITNGTLTSWDNLLENPANQIEHVYAVGLGTGIPGGASNPNLLDVANPVNNGVTETPNTVVLVDDFNDLSATLTGTVGTLNEGNVLDGSIENNDPQGPNPGPSNDPDNVGDGFSHVSFFEYNHPSLNGLDIQITWDGSGAVQPGEVSGGTNTVINGTKVSFDTEYGRMTFDVSNGDYDFIAGAIDNGDKEEHFTYKINDSNGDTSNPADLTVCIKDVYVDQTPITYDDVASGSEPAAQNVNLLLVFDNSGSMADPSGIPGVSKLQAAKQAAINLLNAYAATGGDVRVMLVTFNSNSDRQETWLSLAAAIDAIDDIPQSNSNTNYEAAIQDAIDGFNDTDGRGDFATHDNLVYFLSDGEPTTGGNSGDNSITDGTLTQWDNLLENPANQIDHVYAVGLGTGIPNGASNPNLLDVAQPDGNNNPVNTVVLVDDLTDLSATLTGTIGTPIEGNILDGTNESDPDAPAANTPDFQGDGPAHLSYFEYDSANNDLDIKITWDGSGAVDVDGTANGKATVVNGKEVSFDTDHGRMTIDFTDGDFKLMPATISGGDKTEVFNYKITDSDGDVSNQSKLSVIIDNLPPVATIGDTTVNEGGVANIQVNLSEAAGIGGVTVNYTFQTKAGNTATGGGTDYNTVTSSIFIAAGASSGLISVNAVADAFFEGNETYSVVITSVTGGYTVADDTGLVTINDTTTLTVPLNSHSTPDGNWPDDTSGSGFDNGDDTATDTGGADNDGWDGEGGDDTLNGAGGNDYLRGGNDDDIVNGGAGNDRVRGDSGDDTLTGGDGIDRLQGDGGFDKFDGGANNDWLEADADDFGTGRSIHGGSGVDVLDLDGIGNFTLTGKTAGVDGIEIISLEGGSGGGDTLSLKASDVTDIADGNELFIWGDSEDNVNLTNGGWSTVATNVAGSDGSTYDIFQNGAIKVHVETELDVVLS